MHMHTYASVRANIRARREGERVGEGGRRVNPLLLVYTVPGRETSKVLRLHVHGGVRALVPMLSADIPRDRPRARAGPRYYHCGTESFSYGPRALGNVGTESGYLAGRIRTHVAWAIYV